MGTKPTSICNIHAWKGEGRCPMCYPSMIEPGKITYLKDIPPPGPVVMREGTKHITTLPDGEPCVGILMFKDTMYVATAKGVYKMVGDKLEAVQFVVKDELCDHGKGLTEYCEPCGRVNGGG